MLGGPTPLGVSSYTSYHLYKVQGPSNACRQSNGQNTFSFFNFKGGPVFASQTKTREENVLGGPTPFWVSSYTSYLLYKVQGPFSTCRQSHGQNIFSSIFKEGPVSASQSKTQEENVLAGPTPLWVSSYTSYLLYKVEAPFSTCRQSHDQNTFSFF